MIGPFQRGDELQTGRNGRIARARGRLRVGRRDARRNRLREAARIVLQQRSEEQAIIAAEARDRTPGPPRPGFAERSARVRGFEVFRRCPADRRRLLRTTARRTARRRPAPRARRARRDPLNGRGCCVRSEAIWATIRKSGCCGAPSASDLDVKLQHRVLSVKWSYDGGQVVGAPTHNLPNTSRCLLTASRAKEAFVRPVLLANLASPSINFSGKSDRRTSRRSLRLDHDLRRRPARSPRP